MNMTLPLAALAAAFALSGCQQAQEDAFGQRVRAYLLEHPEVLQEVAAKLQENEQLRVQTASKAALQKFRAQLERDPRDVVINPAGSVTVVEFFDYNCGYCKLAAPEVMKLIEENPDVRFVFKEFAFQTDHSVLAAKIALTPVAKARGLALHRGFMAQKPLNDATIDRTLVAAGVDPAAARAAAADPAIERQIMDTHALARSLGIDGTPAFVVGDRIINGADIAGLRAAVAEAKSAALRKPSGKPT